MKTLYLAFLALIITSGVTAQELPYDLNISTVPFEPLENPISLSNGDIWDDPEYAIPFDLDFKMNDISLTSLSISENLLGGALGFSNDANDFYAVGLLADLIEPAGLTGLKAESEISYEVTGTVGNRILKVQWENAGFFDDTQEAQSRTTFQIWLYEGIYDIRICFGPNTVQQELIEATSLTTLAVIFDLDFYEYTAQGSWLLSGDPLTAEAQFVDFLDYDYDNLPNFTTYPADGTCFHYATGLVNTPELNSGEFSIYPSVATDVVNVLNKGNGTATIDILNLGGQVVATEVMTSNSEIMNVSNLSAGIYFCRIQSEGSFETYRFIKK